jgi:hypothetical protein
MGTLTPTETSTGADLAAKGPELQADLKKVHDHAKPTMPAAISADRELQKFTPLRQLSKWLDEEHAEVSIGHFDGATEGAIADGAQHLGDPLDAMLEAGVAADGGSKFELGSIMKMAVLSDGEFTPVRCSKRNADSVDVDSLERAERRVAVKNLDEPQGILDVHSFCSFSNVRIEENLGEVGISLGNKDNSILGSVSLIKDVERERLKAPECSNKFEIDTDFEEDEIDPDTSTISRLCGDLTEEVMDDSFADLDGVLVDVPIKVAKSKKKLKLLNRNTASKKKTKLLF